jgi:TfoX/Sxy family transcriptional regulator of competence genes
MATKKETADYIVDQLGALPVRARAMFGEYGVYCGDKFVSLICDDTLFVKPTASSAEFLSDDHRAAPPYPGAKDHYVVPGERIDDREWLQAFIARTAAELPRPKKKVQKSA